jgi:hypothetical protein
MKKTLFIFLMAIATCNYGYSNDSLKIVTLQREVSILRASVSRLQQENGKIHGLYEQQKAIVDSLSDIQNQQSENLNTLANKLNEDLTETNMRIDNNASSLSNTIKSRTLLATMGILIALVMLGVVYYLLRKKILNGSSSIDKIKTAQDRLAEAQRAMQEESVKLDNKLVEIMDKQVAMQPQSANNDQPDHSLAMKVADEIVRIETNLSRMDESVKGYKQLKKAVERIRTNFLANGYEIVEMLGKPYNEGMKVVANFVSDDTLTEGEQKITGIIKPQINYKGKMIQSAQITVSQDL